MLRLALFSLVTLIAAGPAFSAAVAPAPFAATYAVSYRGLHAGELHFELRAEGDDRFVYQTRVTPSGLARFIVNRKAVERSVLEIAAEGVRPLSWYMDDGRSGQEGKGSLEFDWREELVRGTVDGRAVELPTVPGLQDRLSVQIEVVTTLLRGGEPTTIPLVDDDEIKRYSYTRVTSERIRTKAGTFDTVLYQSTRPGSRRFSRFWHAPELGYIPVRFEQARQGRVETVMELIRLERK